MCACVDVEDVDVKPKEDCGSLLSEFLEEDEDLKNSRQILAKVTPSHAKQLCEKLLECCSDPETAVARFLDVNGWDLLVSFFELRERVRISSVDLVIKHVASVGSPRELLIMLAEVATDHRFRTVYHIKLCVELFNATLSRVTRRRGKHFVEAASIVAGLLGELLTSDSSLDTRASPDSQRGPSNKPTDLIDAADFREILVLVHEFRVAFVKIVSNSPELKENLTKFHFRFVRAITFAIGRKLFSIDDESTQLYIKATIRDVLEMCDNFSGLLIEAGKRKTRDMRQESSETSPAELQDDWDFEWDDEKIDDTDSQVSGPPAATDSCGYDNQLTTTDLEPDEVSCFLYIWLRTHQVESRDILAFEVPVPIFVALLLPLVQSSLLLLLGLELASAVLQILPKRTLTSIALAGTQEPVWVLMQHMTTIFSQVSDREGQKSIWKTIKDLVDLFDSNGRFGLITEAILHCPFLPVKVILLSQLKAEVFSAWTSSTGDADCRFKSGSCVRVLADVLSSMIADIPDSVPAIITSANIVRFIAIKDKHGNITGIHDAESGSNTFLTSSLMPVSKRLLATLEELSNDIQCSRDSSQLEIMRTLRVQLQMTLDVLDRVQELLSTENA